MTRLRNRDDQRKSDDAAKHRLVNDLRGRQLIPLMSSSWLVLDTAESEHVQGHTLGDVSESGQSRRFSRLARVVCIVEVWRCGSGWCRAVRCYPVIERGPITTARATRASVPSITRVLNDAIRGLPPVRQTAPAASGSRQRKTRRAR